MSRCLGDMMRAMASPRQESESLDVQVLVDSIPALIHTARPDGYLDYFNKPWLEYLGVTLDKVAGLPRNRRYLRVRNSRPQGEWRIPLDVPPESAPSRRKRQHRQVVWIELG